MNNVSRIASREQQNSLNAYILRETGKKSRIEVLNEKIAQSKQVDNWFKNSNPIGDNFPQGYPSWF